MIADFIKRRILRRRDTSTTPTPQPHPTRERRALAPVTSRDVADIAALRIHPQGPWRERARTARGIGRLAAITVWVPLSVGFEAVLLLVPGTAKIRWTRFVWGGLCFLLSMNIRVIGRRAGSVGGARARARGERPVIYVSNHSSWLDVPVLGTVLPSNFVAKGDIEKWPIMGLVSRIGRTIFVSRQRSTTGRERDEMMDRLIGGDNLVLFPEGTSSDGSRVLPFMSAFFAIAKLPRIPRGRENTPEAEAMRQHPPGMTPLIQPVSVVYDRLEGVPVNRARRPVFAWYGDMELGPHVWQLVKWRSMRATVMLHPALDPDDFPSRKALAQAAWRAVSQGAAELRQNAEQDPAACEYACRPLGGLLPQDLHTP
ncbi:1-acyl-sn-glycerol-3-phosphate acyltransferase [Novacetimonas hansenii]|uniref:1-acyl-sn-glycerol-3-phosphate acyltransferase n=1 Tax=Novacetimonas hansenii TaxID=436 RepID=A0AAW5ETH8_NOVHA|nr:lysophospholipid acyltransferase family protein [Novacetimonas hansenii]MBL7235270.1 1-acyl-sn-glycerol-3-phosphate acyltransferase [Novacetimonas hansenii]MCJ8355142.1 1-acyl-sn-glycerol-3-phosphate acyltransferase [Novacetimonas hansenii]PYD73426.1 1-acyl-sn-glycerol-3-phosphate acyltransferase [Novacetimonas hansenii]QOF95713.1 1-acyl-sn-glycerol-3-phosphate acyltransferase [Novacetimonas hansenii]RFP00731.1 acyl-phosphate glycerol 3-phosphate acyltransferase [Novacetimonas hansenii]